MDRYVRRAGEIWGGLSPIRKGLLTATGVGLIALVFVMYTWSGKTSYVSLYTGLDSADSGRILDGLRAKGVSFQLSAGGASVLVPEKQVDELRVAFATQGLPQGGHVGFEIFQSNSLTATDFVQRLNFQRGLEGELARTIESFPAVEHSRVHIVMPERSLFKNDQRPATTSVVLQQRPGRGLSPDEVAGIAHLVAGAVEGLARKDITIVDSSGAMLYDGAQVDGKGLGSSTHQLDLQHQFEGSLEHNVQTVLDRALGPAKALVSVRATLGFDQVETQTEAFVKGSPTDVNGIPRSTVSTTETYAAAPGSTIGAVPGAVANVPGANAALPGGVAGAAAAAGTNYQRTETTSNFEVGKTVTKSVGAVGNVKRLSVSLLLDDTVSDAQATALQASVAAAAGIDTTRGDTIVMNKVPFDHTAVDRAKAEFAAEGSSNKMLSYARMALPVIALLVGFIFFRMLMKSISKRSYRTVAVGEYSEEQLAQLPPGQAATLAVAQAARATRAMLPPVEEIQRSDLELQVAKLAASHPETVAEVVQSWMRED